MAGEKRTFQHLEFGAACSFHNLEQDFPPHFHDYYVIGYIESGRRKFTCSGKTYVLMPGDLIFINPEQTHSCLASGNEKINFYSLQLSRNFFVHSQTFQMHDQAHFLFNHNVLKNTCLSAHFLRLFDLNSNAKNHLKNSIMDFLHLLQDAEGKFIHFFPDVHAYRDCLVENIRSMVENLGGCNISLEMMAAWVKMDKFSFIRYFNKVCGITPYRFLETMRVNKVRELLASGYSAIDAAQILGFADQSHMSRAFKARHGITPGEFKISLLKKRRPR